MYDPIDAPNFSRTDRDDAHRAHDHRKMKIEFEEGVPPPDEQLLEYYLEIKAVVDVDSDSDHVDAAVVANAVPHSTYSKLTPAEKKEQKLKEQNLPVIINSRANY